jgi:hypothetical protein
MARPRLLTSDQAAAEIGVAERTLRKLRKNGLIRYVAVTERKIMYREEDCVAYLEARVRQDEPNAKPERPAPKARQRGVVLPFTKQIT